MTTTTIPVVGIDQATVETCIRPPNDWLLVRLDPRIDATKGGILVPDESRPPARTGVIVAQGNGCLSDDGRTRMPMSASPGARVLFEPSAGKSLPMVERETSERGGWGYRLMRDGSLCGIVLDLVSTDPGHQRALDAGAAGLPARPAGSEIPVTACGELTAERIAPFQDWMVLQPDLPATTFSPSGRKVRGPNGRPILRPETAPMGSPEAEELWGCTILRRGPGLVSITRCLDGDRINAVPEENRIAKVGGRVLVNCEPPYAQAILDFAPLHCGAPFLAREMTIVAVVGDAA